MWKHTIEDMQVIAESRGGFCLSRVYVNIFEKLLWKCAKGHKWEARPNDVKRGQWCPVCAGRQRLTIEHMHRLAKKQGGKCLSHEYVNNGTHLQWQCAQGHIWWAKPSNVNTGHWCSVCSGNRCYTIERVQDIAIERGGKCLSDSYRNNKTPLLWECGAGHQWETPLSNVLSGNWCPYCARTVKLTIEQMQQIAASRGGKCLSEVYVNSGSKLLWECAEGHTWEAVPDNIQLGAWCPECSTGIGERICRLAFEQLFGQSFPTSYPTWLRTPENRCMHLDGYCEDLGLAFEHQGLQHYGNVPRFSQTSESLAYRQQLDKLKRRLCKRHGVILVEVPQIPYLLAIADIPAFLKKEFRRLKISCPVDIENFPFEWGKAYQVPKLRERLLELQRIANTRGGQCLSEHYVNNNTPMLWECSKGHTWEAVASSVKSRTWCPYCAGNRRLTILDMRRYAEERGGQCLSKEYRNNSVPLHWRCSQEHEWERSWATTKRGNWCLQCKKNEIVREATEG